MEENARGEVLLLRKCCLREPRPVRIRLICYLNPFGLRPPGLHEVTLTLTLTPTTRGHHDLPASSAPSAGERRHKRM